MDALVSGGTGAADSRRVSVRASKVRGERAASDRLDPWLTARAQEARESLVPRDWGTCSEEIDVACDGVPWRDARDLSHASLP